MREVVNDSHIDELEKMAEKYANHFFLPPYFYDNSTDLIG